MLSAATFLCREYFRFSSCDRFGRGLNGAFVNTSRHRALLRVLLKQTGVSFPRLWMGIPRAAVHGKRGDDSPLFIAIPWGELIYG